MENDFIVLTGYILQIWVASLQSQSENRPPLAFNSPFFEEGSYSDGHDLYFVEEDGGVDEGCSSGHCDQKRKGLCALPTMRQPRTLIPPPPHDNCPPKKVGDEGWPYTDYEWNADGTPGQTMTQVGRFN